MSVIKALDFTEIRTAVNAVQTLAGTAPTGYTDPTLNNTVTVKKVHIDEPLTRLNAARTALGLSDDRSQRRDDHAIQHAGQGQRRQ